MNITRYWKSWDCVAPGFAAALEYLRRLDLDRDAAELLWKTRHKKVFRVVLPEDLAGKDGENAEVVWKYYGEKRFFRYLFRPSLAAREWRGYALAAATGVPVAGLLAAGETRRGLRLTESFLVTRMVRESADGDDFLSGGAREKEHEAAFEFARQNMVYLGWLHRAGLIHGGFHPRNELYRMTAGANGASGKLEVIWIDLATCKRPAWYSKRRLQQEDLDYFLREMAFPADEGKKLREVYFTSRNSNGTNCL